MVINQINAVATIKHQIGLDAFADQNDVAAFAAIADDPVNTGEDLFATRIDQLDRAGCNLFDDIGFVRCTSTDAAIPIAGAHIQGQVAAVLIRELDGFGQFQITDGKVQVQPDPDEQDLDACICLDVDRHTPAALDILDLGTKADAGPAPIDAQTVQADRRTTRETDCQIAWRPVGRTVQIIVIDVKVERPFHSEAAAAQQHAAVQGDVKRPIAAENAICRHRRDAEEVDIGVKVNGPCLVHDDDTEGRVELDGFEELNVTTQREAEAIGFEGKAANPAFLIGGVQRQPAACVDIDDPRDICINRHGKTKRDAGDLHTGIIQPRRTRRAYIQPAKAKDDIKADFGPVA